MGRKHKQQAREVQSSTDATWMVPAEQPTALRPEARQALRRLRRAQSRSAALSPLAYNVTLSHRHRFVWYRNAKVGTRTMLDVFEQHDPDLLRLSFTPLPTAQLTDYRKFAFVRHPLDRFVSAWQDKVHGRNKYKFDAESWERMKTIEHFAEWVAGQDLHDLSRTDRHIALQTRLVDLSQVDFLGRIERFDADFAALCGSLGLPWSEPARRNASSPRGVTRESASADLVAIVEETYRLDYQVLGY